MSYLANTETLEGLTLTSDFNVLLDNVKLMLQLGYRGTVSFETGENARINMTMAEGVAISAGVGDTILYHTTPTVAVVKCVTAEELAANYHTV